MYNYFKFRLKNAAFCNILLLAVADLICLKGDGVYGWAGIIEPVQGVSGSQ